MENLARYTFIYVMYVCVSIYRNDSLLMTTYKYEKCNKTRCPRFNVLHECARAIPRHVVSILLGEKYILSTKRNAMFLFAFLGVENY